MIIITGLDDSIINSASVDFVVAAEQLPDVMAIRDLVVRMLEKESDSHWLLEGKVNFYNLANTVSITKHGSVALECQPYNLLFTGKEAKKLRRQILKTITPRITQLDRLMNVLMFNKFEEIPRRMVKEVAPAESQVDDLDNFLGGGAT